MPSVYEQGQEEIHDRELSEHYEAQATSRENTDE